MATKEYTITGKAMWAKVFDSNKEMKDWQGNAHPFGGLFKIDLILDKDNKAIYKASGTSGKGKFDDDGNFIATLKRKENDRFEWAGGPPKVFNKDGSDFTGTIIPNGSTVEVKFTVFTTSMQPGTRLESVTVLDLVEMPARDETPVAKEEPKAPASSDSKVDIPF